MERDAVDDILESWARQRPDLDVSPVGVVARVLRLARHWQASLDEAAAAHGLRDKRDLDILTALLRAGGRHELTPSRIARHVMMTSGGLTPRLDGLEAAGLVRRHPNPANRRGTLVRLTGDGLDLVDRVYEDNLTTQHATLDVLAGDDRVRLAGYLRRLLVAADGGRPR